MKILINALSGIGDALMFSPALKLMKENIPGITIDMLAMFKSVKEMYQESPYINKIHYINFLNQGMFKSIKELFELRANNYDYSINIYPSNRLEYNIVNFILGSRKRIAYHYLHTHIFRAEFLNQILINEEKNIHNVLQNFKIAKFIKGSFVNNEIPPMELFINKENISNGENWIRVNNPENKIIVGFHAGSSTLKNHIHKRWAMEKYAELGKKLIEEWNALILLFGNEFDLNNEIKSLIGGKAIIASTNNFMDSMARMKHCNLFISNDTAFLHTAAAFQINTVGVFAYTNHLELYPWKTNHIIVRKELKCSPCFYNSPRPARCLWKGDDEFMCINNISVEEVLNACRVLLKQIRSKEKSI